MCEQGQGKGRQWRNVGGELCRCVVKESQCCEHLVTQNRVNSVQLPLLWMHLCAVLLKNTETSHHWAAFCFNLLGST